MPRSRNPARVANTHAVPSSSRSVVTAPGVRTASTSAFGNAARRPSAAMATKPLHVGPGLGRARTGGPPRPVRARPRPARRGRARTGGRARRRTPPPARLVSARRPRRCGRRPRPSTSRAARRGVEHAATFTLPDQVRVGAGGAETLVVGGGDHVAAREEVGDVRHRARGVGRHATARMCRPARWCRAPSSSPAGRRGAPRRWAPPRAPIRPRRGRRARASGRGRATPGPRPVPRSAPPGSACPGRRPGAGTAAVRRRRPRPAERGRRRQRDGRDRHHGRHDRHHGHRRPHPRLHRFMVAPGAAGSCAVRPGRSRAAVCAALVAGALEQRLQLRPDRGRGGVGGDVGPLLGVGGEVVQLPLASTGGGANGSAGCRGLLPLGEPLVVVVELPELGARRRRPSAGA